MQITTKTSYYDFFRLWQTYRFEDRMEELFENVRKYPLPKKMDVNFEELTFGYLRRLQTEITTPADIFTKPFEILLDMKQKKYMKMKAVDCLRFVLHVKDNLEAIVKLFGAIQYQPNEDEIRAGINKLSGGFFDTADWYARRMGITNHNEVDKVRWGIIYLAKKKDFEEYQFQENYRKVIEQKHKQQRHG